MAINAHDDYEEARRAIGALLKAAADHTLSDEQAKALIIEARKNAEIAFGDNAGTELTEIIIQQVILTFENGAASVERLGRHWNFQLE